jgi:hypothetical protein
MDASRRALKAVVLPISSTSREAQKKPLERMRAFLQRLEGTYEKGRDKGYKWECHAVWRAMADHFSILDKIEMIKVRIHLNGG